MTRSLLNRRFGFTLVELLIVMSLLIVLAAVTLPSLRTVLAGQKVSSASRAIKSHFDAARARAIATGRPVAVIMNVRRDSTASEPVDIANNLSTVLSLSTGTAFPAYTGDTTSALATFTSNSSITVNATDASLCSTGVFQAGDLIRFDNAGPFFTIIGTPTTTINFLNPDRDGSTTLAEEYQLASRGAASFAIYRQPSRSFEPPTAIPKGTCIDLSVSGLGTNGNAKFSSAIAGGNVTVVFSPTGIVERITYGSGSTVTVERPTSLIHFMIGRVEQVNTFDLLVTKNPDDPSSIGANLNDPENLWLTINPFTGAIYTSKNFPGNENSGDIATRIQTARTYAASAITQTDN